MPLQRSWFLEELRQRRLGSDKPKKISRICDASHPTDEKNNQSLYLYKPERVFKTNILTLNFIYGKLWNCFLVAKLNKKTIPITIVFPKQITGNS